jgi:hypothetical protein
MARTITAIRHRGHNLTRARERSAITISNPCTDQMPAHYTRSPQAHTSRKLPLRIYFDARRPTWGCIFEFRTRRKPFRVKTNRSNGRGSHNGGTYNDSKNGAGLEANIPIVSPGLASTITLALRGPASPAVRVQCQSTNLSCAQASLLSRTNPVNWSTPLLRKPCEPLIAVRNDRRDGIRRTAQIPPQHLLV